MPREEFVSLEQSEAKKETYVAFGLQILELRQLAVGLDPEYAAAGIKLFIYSNSIIKRMV